MFTCTNVPVNIVLALGKGFTHVLACNLPLTLHPRGVVQLLVLANERDKRERETENERQRVRERE